jgi:hypothetical protein
MSYHDLADISIDYQVQIRDRDVEIKGICTIIRRPIVENKLDFYGDPISQYGNDEQIYIIPQYDGYYQIIDLLGQDVEATLPLKAIVKVSDYIPNDSVVHLAVRNNKGTMEKRWWRIQSTSVKHLESHYSRIANLAPVREPLFNVPATVNIQSMSGGAVTSRIVQKGFLHATAAPIQSTSGGSSNVT